MIELTALLGVALASIGLSVCWLLAERQWIATAYHWADGTETARGGPPSVRAFDWAIGGALLLLAGAVTLPLWGTVLYLARLLPAGQMLRNLGL